MYNDRYYTETEDTVLHSENLGWQVSIILLHLLDKSSIVCYVQQLNYTKCLLKDKILLPFPV